MPEPAEQALFLACPLIVERGRRDRPVIAVARTGDVVLIVGHQTVQHQAGHDLPLDARKQGPVLTAEAGRVPAADRAGG